MEIEAHFLTVLDALVLSGDAPPGFTGRVCVGVRSGVQDRWWWASFGERVETRFLDHVPPETDAAFLIGEAEAEAILCRAPLPERPLLLWDGDRRLLRRLVERYVRTNSFISVFSTQQKRK